jgi:hypothetical protein
MRFFRSVKFGVCVGVLGAAFALGQASGVQIVPTPPAEGPNARDQRVLLGRVRLEALRYQRELPDFICDQLTTRSIDDSGSGKHWKLRDKLQVQDVYVGGFVNHILIAVNGKDATKNYRALDGFLSETVLHSVGFLPAWLFGPQAKTQFEWLREDMLDGRKMQVFSVHLPAVDSQFTISAQRQSFVAGIDGEIYVDAMAAVVRRFTIKMDLPANSVLQEGTLDINYGLVSISSREFLLPIRFAVRARYGGSMVKNETQVVRYQKYAAVTTIHFDEPPPADGPQATN